MTERRTVDGLLLIDKPKGMSSNQCLQAIKYRLRARKAGHTGSLDPLATGMLPLCFGEATKFAQRLLTASKTYEVIMRLGWISTTLDAEGTLTHVGATPLLSTEAIENVLTGFRGTQQQIPPMYSALKHQGRPLYELAREGVQIDRAARAIEIHDLRCIDHVEDTLTLSVSCSKGTYIRSLVDDLGRALGCGAYVLELRRTHVSGWSTMHTFESVVRAVEGGDWESLLLPVHALLDDCEKLVICPQKAYNLRLGQVVSGLQEGEAGMRAVFCEHQFLGLAELDQMGALKPVRLLSTR